MGIFHVNMANSEGGRRGQEFCISILGTGPSRGPLGWPTKNRVRLQHNCGHYCSVTARANRGPSTHDAILFSSVQRSARLPALGGPQSISIFNIAVLFEGYQGAPMMPRGANLSDGCIVYTQSAHVHYIPPLEIYRIRA